MRWVWVWNGMAWHGMAYATRKIGEIRFYGLAEEGLRGLGMQVHCQGKKEGP